MDYKKHFSGIIIVALLWVFNSCTEKVPVNESAERSLNKNYVEGLVIFTGNIEVDGCGYMVQFEDQIYKPLNLPKSFEIDSLKILAEFEIATDKYQCGLSPIPKSTITFLEILENK